MERSTWHDEFDRCPGCRHATIGFQRPWGIHHAEGCEVAEFIARTADHRGAVDEIEMLRREAEGLVNALCHEGYSTGEIGRARAGRIGGGR